MDRATPYWQGVAKWSPKRKPNVVQKSPKMEPFWEPPVARNALFSYCFRTKTAPTGPPKVLRQGTPKGSQKEVRNDAKMEAKAGPPTGRPPAEPAASLVS